MKIKQLILVIQALFFVIIVSNTVIGQDKPDWEGGFPDGCTSITVGKLASADGSVFTSHTDDSHRKAGKQKKAIEYLTNYTIDWGEKVVKKAWELGDLLWTRYDEKF